MTIVLLASNLQPMSELGRDPKNKKHGNMTTEFHVNRVRAGDPSAFAQLYERLAPSLDAWSQLRVTGSLRDYIEPSDIVQEVWWRAMDAFDRFDSAKSGFRPWIFTIATNVLLEWNRKRRRKIRIEPKSVADRAASLPPVLAKQATSVGRGLSLNESVKKLVTVVSMLSEEDRTVFMHCGLEGLGASEVAMLVGSNADAVNKRWQRLREKLGANPIWHEFDPQTF